jgi:hypothetical protein
VYLKIIIVRCAYCVFDDNTCYVRTVHMVIILVRCPYCVFEDNVCYVSVQCV